MKRLTMLAVAAALVFGSAVVQAQNVPDLPKVPAPGDATLDPRINGGESFYTGVFTLYSDPEDKLPGYDDGRQAATVNKYVYILEDDQTGEQYLVLMLPGHSPVFTHRVNARKPEQPVDPWMAGRPDLARPRECKLRIGYFCFFNWTRNPTN